MDTLRRTVLLSLAAASLSACAATPLPGAVDPGEPDEVLPLWPQGVPGGVPDALKEHIVLRENPFGLLDRAAHEVTSPSLSIFRPRRPDGSAILIIPGGGYKWVVIDKEGFEGARHFRGLGATVYVLRYRLPHQGWVAGTEAPLQDAQRALRLIRSRSSADSIDPSRVTVMGFSAGGHVAGSLASRFDTVVHAPLDSIDKWAARPDAAALIYPVATMSPPYAHEGSRSNLLGAEPSDAAVRAWSLEHMVRADMPPVFLMHASDDAAVPVENSLMLYASLRAGGVSAVLHVFGEGGHGFGLRGISGTSLEVWPELFAKWNQAAS